MKRLTVTALVSASALLAGSGTAHARASFDANVDGLRLTKDDATLRTYDFESADGLVGAQLAHWDVTNYQLVRTPIASAAAVTDLLTAGGADAVEGSHAIRLAGQGLAIADSDLFASLKNSKFEVTFWARSDGGSVQLQVAYDKDPTNVGFSSFANVRGIRTGRETSDGWAEFVAGPLDGSVWGVPVAAILVVPSIYADAEDSFLLDALEIRKVDGKPVEPLACTQQTVDTVCGAEGDCMYGHCVSSTVTWGLLPSPQHRSDLAERWIQFGTRFIGDRNAAAKGASILAPNARLLAEQATSSRQFFGGLNRLVNLLRDNHTSFGSPANYSNFAPQVGYGSSSTLGACFGVVEKDILGGGIGYGVFNVTEKPLTGKPLARGDVLVAIDGRDPKEWVDEVWPRFATTMPNDPASDWGASANDLSRLIAMRANNVTLVRCASPTSCDGADRTTIEIDVATAVYNAIIGDVPEGTSRSFSCSQRFTETVAATGGGSESGEDPVYTAIGDAGETRIQFDGFVGQDAWKASFAGVFNAKPAHVLVDARVGHGGYLDAVQYLYDLVRGTSEPNGVIMLGRGTYDLTDPDWLFSRLGECVIAPTAQNQWTCFQGSASGFFASAAAPPGANSRIAWMNTEDVSANDFMPRLLKGRSNFKIFAPHPTSGAFGAITSLPALWTGWAGGSLQIQDSRFATDLADTPNARWESGHGVAPDLVVTEKLSDALRGVDTIVEAANAWLSEQQ